jgi:hypothetical protein
MKIIEIIGVLVAISWFQKADCIGAAFTTGNGNKSEKPVLAGYDTTSEERWAS